MPVYRIGTPTTGWSRKVDEVEQPFSSDYDREEYKNPALVMLNIAELELVRDAFGLTPNWRRSIDRKMRGKRVLDPGCGTGRIALYAAAKGAWVAALDQTAGYVEATAVKASRLPSDALTPKLFISPVENMLGSNQEMDYITPMFAVLNHCEEWQAVVSGLGRLLSAKGKMTLSMYGSPEAAVFQEIAEGLPYAPAILVRRINGGLLLGETADEVLPANFPYPNEVTECLKEAGLDIEKTVPLLAVTSLYPSQPTPENIQAYIQIIRRRYGKDISDFLQQFASQPAELLVASLRADSLIPPTRINEAAYFGIVASKESKK